MTRPATSPVDRPAGTARPGPVPTPVTVEVRGLRKDYPQGRWTLAQRLRRVPDPRSTVAAVEGIDLTIGTGEIFGLLGPNGAGKTTLVKMLSTLLLPTAGSVSVLGVDAVADPRAVRRRIGVVLGGAERSVYWKLTARENLRYFAALNHLPPAVAARRTDELLAELGLADRADDYVERYSTGMRQRLVIARALLADPAVLLLDEPTVALDPQSAANVRDHIRRLREQGRTVLLTTHDMAEAELLCDRVAIIDHGRLTGLGTVAELKSTVAADQVVRLDLAAAPFDGGRLAAELAGLALSVTSETRASGPRFTLHCDSRADLVVDVVDAARRAGAVVAHVDVVPVTLEDVFFALTGRGLRE